MWYKNLKIWLKLEITNTKLIGYINAILFKFIISDPLSLWPPKCVNLLVQDPHKGSLVKRLWCNGYDDHGEWTALIYVVVNKL